MNALKLTYSTLKMVYCYTLRLQYENTLKHPIIGVFFRHYLIIIIYTTTEDDAHTRTYLAISKLENIILLINLVIIILTNTIGDSEIPRRYRV